MKVLVVDDTASDRLLTMSFLKQLGCNVTGESCPLAAIELVKIAPLAFDLILLDLMMPKLDGLAVAERMRTIQLNNQDAWVPIVFLSAKHTPEDVLNGVKAGGDDYLAKPIDKTLLEAKLIAMERIANMRAQLLQATELLEQEARTDPLTKVFNRRMFEQQLEIEYSRAARYQVPCALVMFDLDHFKAVNDDYGHDAGDEVLRVVAKCIKEKCRKEDVFCRVGGEEFAIIMPHTAASEANALAERFREAIAEQIISISDDKSIKVTASFGVSDTHLLSAQKREKDLPKSADVALYRAKSAGRNRVMTFTIDMFD